MSEKGNVHTVQAGSMRGCFTSCQKSARAPLHKSQALNIQGALRVNRYNPYEGYVGSDSVGQDILLAGRSYMNRAMDGE
eukprot:1036763-Pelagomonas_calceolata.AAC.11